VAKETDFERRLTLLELRGEIEREVREEMGADFVEDEDAPASGGFGDLFGGYLSRLGSMEPEAAKNEVGATLGMFAGLAVSLAPTLGNMWRSFSDAAKIQTPGPKVSPVPKKNGEIDVKAEVVPTEPAPAPPQS